MAFTLETIQEDILAFLQESTPWKVEETGIPDIDRVPKQDGKIIPYVIVQFGDIAPNGRRAMSGAFDDDYRLPLYITVIGPEAGVTRKVYNRLILSFLGKTFDWAGQIRKTGGGGSYSATSSTGGTEAYAFPATFTLGIQLAETPDP